MHKNSYNPKSLIGNWHENRYTDEYDAQSDATSNTYLQNPCKWPQAGEQEISLSIFDRILTFSFVFFPQLITNMCRSHAPSETILTTTR